jgi:magnesium-transporting ATPase (P-type)
VLAAGDRVSADLQTGEVHGLQVDESTLTGESMPVYVEADGPVHAGTVVVEGEAKTSVTATGARTRLAGIAELTDPAGRGRRQASCALTASGTSRRRRCTARRRELALVAACCSSGRPVRRDSRWVAEGDPMEAALVTLTARLGVEVNVHRAAPGGPHALSVRSPAAAHVGAGRRPDPRQGRA